MSLTLNGCPIFQLLNRTKHCIVVFGRREQFATKVDKEFFFHCSVIIWFYLHTSGLYGNNFLKLVMNLHCNVFKK